MCQRFPSRDFMGRVSAINPSVDPNSRAFILEARFDNPKAQLQPGMFATARVLLPGNGGRGVRTPSGRASRPHHGLQPGIRDRESRRAAYMSS